MSAVSNELCIACIEEVTSVSHIGHEEPSTGRGSFRQARQRSATAAAAAAAAVAGSGYDTDDEVYRTASAVDAADGIRYDSDDNQILAGVERRKVAHPSQ